MVMKCKYEYVKVKNINELRHAAHYKWSSTGRLPKIVPNVKVAAELIILIASCLVVIWAEILAKQSLISNESYAHTINKIKDINMV